MNKQLFEFVCRVEHGANVDDIENVEEVKGQITKKLEIFANLSNNNHECKPLVYHLDVGAMYPNIILTNRLQPVSVVDDKM